MAIEALRQIHDNGSLPFEGVSVRDLDIYTALVVPEGEEVEIVTTLHTTDDKNYTFTLESVESSQWTLHCKGKISATSEAIAARDHPVEEAALTQRVSGKRWYEAFRRVGFNYTNTFQQMLDVRTDKSLRHSTGNLVVSDNSGVMVDESRYILHPNTIDACLQVIIVAVNAGKHKEMQWGIVPTHIGEISLTFPEAEAESTGHAVAWTDKIEGRRFYTHAYLTDSTGKLIMDINGLECTAYEAVSPQQLTVHHEPEPFSIMTWKPDVETILPNTALKLGSLTGLVELVSHKQPIGSVLISGSPAPSVVESALATLPKDCSITIGVTEEQRAPHIDEELQDRVTLKTSPEEWSTDIAGSQFDLVVADYSGLENWDETIELDSLLPLVSSGGWLVGNRHCFSSLPQSAVTAEQYFAYKQVDAGHVSDIKGGVSQIALVSPGSSASDATSLANVLTERGRSVHQEQLASFVASDGQCVVVDDRQGTALLSLTEKDFSGIKAILASGSSLLWLTQGVQEGVSAEGGLAEGFLRAIRSEQASAKAILLDVDNTESIENVAQAVIGKVDDLSTLSPGSDTEFWLHEGVLRIPRLHPYAPHSATSSQEEPDVHGAESTGPTLSSEGTYVLVGCLGGLGRSLTKWMVEHGARHFAFISRSGASKPEAARVIENIHNTPGTSTRVYRADASDEAAMQCIVYSLQAERPVRGVVHAAMVLKVCQSWPLLCGFLLT